MSARLYPLDEERSVRAARVSLAPPATSAAEMYARGRADERDAQTTPRRAHLRAVDGKRGQS